MTNDEIFSIEHLTYLLLHSYIPSCPMQLGPFVSISDNNEKKVAVQLRDWGFIVNEALSPEAFTALSPLFDFDDGFAGSTFLYNKRQPYKLDVPQVYLDAGIGYSFRDIPTLKFAITYHNKKTFVAVRAGTNLQFYYFAGSGPFTSQCAQALHDLHDPEGIWKPAGIRPIKVPQNIVGSVNIPGNLPWNRPRTKKDVQRFTDLLSGIPSEEARNTYMAFQKFDLNASMNVVHIRDDMKMSSEAMMTNFYAHKGMLCAHTQVMPDHSRWVLIEPATEDAVSKALVTISHSSHVQIDVYGTIS